MANVTGDKQSATYRTGRDPKMYMRLAEGDVRPCIRIRFSTTSKSVSQLFLPVDTSGAIREGMSIKFYDQLSERRSLQLVLPERFAGQTVRFDPDVGGSVITGLEVETGHVDN